MPKTLQLRSLRLAQELTRGELAARAGVGRDTLRRAERGLSVSDVTLAKLARALGVDISKLLPELLEEAS